MQEVAEGSVEAYQLGFLDCRERVSQVYPQLDLSNITINEEHEEEATEEEVVDAEQVTTPKEPVVEFVKMARVDEVVATKEVADPERLAK